MHWFTASALSAPSVFAAAVCVAVIVFTTACVAAAACVALIVFTAAARASACVVVCMAIITAAVNEALGIACPKREVVILALIIPKLKRKVNVWKVLLPLTVLMLGHVCGVCVVTAAAAAVTATATAAAAAVTYALKRALW